MTVIRTDLRLGHEATMQLPSTKVVSPRDLWCHLGQGWCLVAARTRVFFVCFEGATSAHGAFCQEILAGDEQAEGHSRATAILPIDPFCIVTGDDFENLELPFSEPLKKQPLVVQELMGIGGNSEVEEETSE